ncbi:alpha/beta hydrolase [Streptomyces albidoflavus]
MSETSTATRPPEPDLSAITAEGLRAYRDAENRFRASGAARRRPRRRLRGHGDAVRLGQQPPRRAAARPRRLRRTPPPAPGSPLSNAADGWDVLRHMVRHAARRGADPARAAVFGESCGAPITALTAIQARNAYGYSPTRALPQLRLFQHSPSRPEPTPARLSAYPGAQHAFLTLPGVEPQAEAARAEILAFLRAALNRTEEN